MEPYINSEVAEQSLLWANYFGNFILDLLFFVIPWSVLFCFLGLILAGTLSFFIYKKGWLKRDNKIWNAFTKLSYIFIFISFSLSGCTAGGIYGIQRQVDSIIYDDLMPELEKNIPTLHEYITSYVSTETGETGNSDEIVKSILNSLYFEPASDGIWDRTKARCVNWFTLNFGKWLITAGVGAMLAWMMGRTGDDFGLDGKSIEFALDNIKQMDLSKVDNTIAQIAADTLHYQIGIFFNGIYLHILLFPALVLLIAVSESLFYHFWYMKREISIQI